MSTPADANRFATDLSEWAEDNLRTFPWRDWWNEPYEVFLAEFFLVQTPAERVAEFLPGFVSKYPDVLSLEAASEEELREDIEPLGLQHRRASALKQIASAVDGGIPPTQEELQDLPRVGDYVSKATEMYSSGDSYVLLDTNIRRVLDRLLGDDWPDATEAQRATLATVLERYPDGPATAQLALIDFGAIVCKAQRPRCADCFATEYCEYYQRSHPDRD